MTEKDKLGEMVRVEWIDITEEHEIAYDKEVTPLQMTSYGELLRNDADFVVIVRERQWDENPINRKCDKQIFPKGCVTNIIPLMEEPE